MMKKVLLLPLVFVAILTMPLFGQEKEKANQSSSSILPKPLEDDFLKWMIGEWEGWGSSKFSKDQIWQKVELGLDNQFILIHFTGKTTEMSSEQVKAAAAAFKIPISDAEKLKDMVNKGLEIMTINPMTGEFIANTYSNIREMYTATGKREGNKITLNFEGTFASGSSTIEKVNDEKMVMVNSAKLPNGEMMEFRAELARKKMTGKK